jgi:hypothetical protein
MRIISQNSIYNLPYDSIIIRREEKTIQARTITGENYFLGRYSSEEKAERVFNQILICGSNYYRLPKDEWVK